MSYSQYTESEFSYYDSSARKEVGTIRGILNDWFGQYPKDEQFELKQRFRKTFSSAFFELFIYTFFKKLDFEIVIHPAVPDSTKRPDFLMRRKELEFYVEAKDVASKSSAKLAVENMENVLLDKLNQVKSADYLLAIDTLIIHGNQQPETKNLIANFQSWLSLLTQKKDNAKVYKYNIENDKLSLSISAYPKSEDIRNVEFKRPIISHPITVGYDNSIETIRKAIKRKASRYGNIDKPYIIMTNLINSVTCDEDDIIDAIFGDSVIVNHQGELESRRKKNGLIMSNSGPINTRVTAFYFVKVHPYNIANFEFWLYENPFAEKPINMKRLELTYKYLESTYLKTYEGKSIQDIFLK